MHVSEFLHVATTVADLNRIQAFYADGLGFRRGESVAVDDPAWAQLLGLAAPVSMHTVRMGLGSQEVEFVAFDQPGRPYPAQRSSTDPWFQHVAIVVGDIQAAFSRVQRVSAESISTGGPQRLPPNTGSVSAYKFRDPEGHPLELLHLPPGVGDARWHGGAGPDPLGWDHSAIAVADVARSVAFYTEQLGFRGGGQSHNTGVEQDRLDGLTDTVVDVVGLEPVEAQTPHLELLCYRQPRRRQEEREAPGVVRADDIASTRQMHRVDDLDALVERLNATDTTFVSPGIVAFRDGRRATAIRDPDGHMIVLMQ